MITFLLIYFTIGLIIGILSIIGATKDGILIREIFVYFLINFFFWPIIFVMLFNEYEAGK